MKNLLRYSLPAALAAMLWLTMRTDISGGGEAMSAYGFPFAWHAPSSVSSLAFDISIGAFACDLLAYLLVCHALVALVLRNRAAAAGRGMLVTVLLWLAALGSLGITLIELSLAPHFVCCSLDTYFGDDATRTRSLRLGPFVSASAGSP